MKKKKTTLARQLDNVYDEICPNCKPKFVKITGLKARIHKLINEVKGKHKHKKEGHKLHGKAKAEFLKRMNTGRRKKGLKPIHAK